jgi:hypothetical protein
MKTLNLSLLIFLLAACFSACKIDDAELRGFKLIASDTTDTGGGDIDIPGGGGNVGSAEYYFKGKLNGQTLTWPVDKTEKWTEGVSSMGSIDRDTTMKAFGGMISRDIFLVNLPAITIYFKTYRRVGYEFKKELFEAFVTTGNWPYAPTSGLTRDIKDIYITYSDSDKKYYDTVGDQTGSTFTVLSTTIVPEQLGIPERIKIKVKFSCKLYPETGAPLTLTDAEAVVAIEDI